jgi:hypothetical protein
VLDALKGVIYKDDSQVDMLMARRGCMERQVWSGQVANGLARIGSVK